MSSSYVKNAVFFLAVHRDALKAVGEFGGDRVQRISGHVLEICELGDFHAVKPNFPAHAGRAESGALPVVFHPAHVVFARVKAYGAERI